MMHMREEWELYMNLFYGSYSYGTATPSIFTGTFAWDKQWLHRAHREREREREKPWVHAVGYVLYKQNSLHTSAGETVIKAWTARKKLSWTQQSNHTRKKEPEEPQKVREPVKDKKAEVGAHSTQLVTLGQLTFEHISTVSQVSQTRKYISYMSCC